MVHMEYLPQLLDYNSPHLFLNDLYLFKKKQNPLFSVRSWSKRMKFSTHTTLSFILKGSRKILPNHLPNLYNGFKLTRNEKDYFESLVFSENSSDTDQKEKFLNDAQKIKVYQDCSEISFEVFEQISNWYTFALLEMTELADFSNDLCYLQKRLGHMVSKEKIQYSLKLLQEVGLLESINGKLKKTKKRIITKKDGDPNQAITEYHSQVAKLASTKIKTQTPTERIAHGCSMTINKNKMHEANQLIIDFRSNMAKLMEKKNGDETYQLSIQFFRLTENAL